MKRESIKPTVEKKERCPGATPTYLYKHPAFGVITMTHPRGHSSPLFGSDIGHSETVRIAVHRAELVRELSHDWHRQLELPVIEFEMSHAQFAQFITSQGSGAGTPVTINFASPVGAHREDMPHIAAIESKHELFHREIKDAAKVRLSTMASLVNGLGELIEGGKTNKTELRKIHAELKRHTEQLPGSVSFVVKQAEEALEKATSDAKIEVEAFIGSTVNRLGLESLQQLAQLTNKETKHDENKDS